LENGDMSSSEVPKTEKTEDSTKKRLIDEIRKNNPDFTFEWVIETPDDKIKVPELIPSGITPRLVHSLGELTESDFENFQASHFIHFPDFVGFPPSVMAYIIGKLKTPLLLCSEYASPYEENRNKTDYNNMCIKRVIFELYPDLKESEVEALYKYVTSGFHKTGIGVFTEEF
jgi:hypothetical protein